MFDKEAITELQQGAAIVHAEAALRNHRTTDNLVGLPKDFVVHDLEQYLPNCSRARGIMKTESVGDFAEYFTTHAEAGATVFVDKNSMQAHGVMNLGSNEQPGHADNRAVLTLKSMAAYDAFRDMANGGPRTQGQVAEWIEDWQDMIQCLYKPDDQEQIGTVLHTPKAIAAIRSITIDAARKVESEEGQLSASKSAFESVKASSKHILPTLIVFKTVPYVGLPERIFNIRLGILTGGDKTTLVLRPIKLEEHKQEMAEQFTNLVADHIADTNHQVLIGTYSKERDFRF
jgi:uncharacterized protein YfdQ (DUF2303 family)